MADKFIRHTDIYIYHKDTGYMGIRHREIWYIVLRHRGIIGHRVHEYIAQGTGYIP